MACGNPETTQTPRIFLLSQLKHLNFLLNTYEHLVPDSKFWNMQTVHSPLLCGIGGLQSRGTGDRKVSACRPLPFLSINCINWPSSILIYLFFLTSFCLLFQKSIALMTRIFFFLIWSLHFHYRFITLRFVFTLRIFSLFMGVHFLEVVRETVFIISFSNFLLLG